MPRTGLAMLTIMVAIIGLPLAFGLAGLAIALVLIPLLVELWRVN